METVDPSSIADIQALHLDTYRSNPDRVESDAGTERQDRADYEGRFIFELLQNAVDEMDDTKEPRVKLELTEDSLLVANNGSPFSIDDLYALTLTTRTTKAGEATIGHKGRGFTSVLGITDNPRVYSHDVQAQFDRRETAQLLNQDEAVVTRLGRELGVHEVPLLGLPHDAEQPEEVTQLLEGEFTTVFELPLREPSRDVGSITRKLQSLGANTVALLPQLNRIDMVCADWERTWDISRTDITEETNQTLVRLDCETTTGGNSETETHRFILFERTEIDLDRITSRVDLTQPEIDAMGELSVGVAFAARPTRGDPDPVPRDWKLNPVYGETHDRAPHLHVFLPTTERSPIPALVTGTFQSDTSRRNLTLNYDDEQGYEGQFNTLLFREIGQLFEQSVVPFVTASATEPGDLLDALDPSLGQRREWSFTPGSVEHCLFEVVKEHLATTPFLPTAFDNDQVAIDTVSVPPTSSEINGLGERFVELLQTATSVEDPPTVPAASLLSHEKAQTLTAYSAETLSTADVPAVLGQAKVKPPLRETTEREWGLYDDEAVSENQGSEDGERDSDVCRLTIDPVLEYLVQLRKTLESDQERDDFDTTCRHEALFPVEISLAEDGRRYATRKANEDGSLFMPPEDDIEEGALPALEFLARELYYGTNPDRAQQLREAALPAEFSSDVKTIWDVNDYQFASIFNVGIRPFIPGPNSPDADTTPLEDVEALKTIQGMAAVHSPETERSPDSPLLYQSTRKSFTDLTKLPIPTITDDKDIEWEPAHRVYFSSTWQSALGRSDEIQIELLLEEVREQTDSERYDPKFLAPPQYFGIDTEGENESQPADLAEWVEFFKWLGVFEHIRPLPLFAPDAGTQQRYKRTKGLTRPPRSTISAMEELHRSGDTDTPVDHRYTGLTEQQWEAYRSHLEEHVNPKIPDADEQYIFQINSLEYRSEIVEAAEASKGVGNRLLQHLVAWWDEGLADRRHAIVVEFTNDRWRRSNISYVFSSSELKSLGHNLWVWQLRQSSWVPTTFDVKPPTAAWSLPKADHDRVSLKIARNHSLLPFITGQFPTRESDTEVDVETLAKALGIGLRLEEDEFSPTDAYHVLNSIGELLKETSKDLKQFSSAVELLYTRVAELIPGLKQGEIPSDEWQPENSGLDSVDLLCRVGDGYDLVTADSVYFVRSRSQRDRYERLGVPVVTLFKSEAAGFGAHCGLTDLVAVADKEPGYTDSPPLPLPVDGFSVETEWLQTVLAALLLRLQTDRPLVDQDTNNTRSFFEEIKFVEGLDLQIKLDDETWNQHLEPQPRGYHIERDGETVEQIFIDTTLDRSGFVDALTGAYTDRLRVPQYYEAVNNLIDHAFGTQSPEPVLRERLRTVGNEVPQGQIETTRKKLFTEDDPEPDPEEEDIDIQRSDPPKSVGEGQTVTDMAQEATPNGGGTTEPGTAAHSSQVPEPDAVTRIGDRRIHDLPEPSVNNGSTEEGESTSSNHSGSGNDSGSGGASTPASQEYRSKIDAFGMTVTIRAERSRLMKCGESDPASKVFDVHTPQTYQDARCESTLLEDAIQNFATQRGLEDGQNPLETDWPGFDVLTIKTDEDGEPVINRCIELKTSGVNTRKPSLSWNEWKAAGGPLRDHYYLYVARNIRSGNSGDAELLEIPQPFDRLEERKRETRERNVQVDLRSFDLSDEPIIEQTIEWEDE